MSATTRSTSPSRGCGGLVGASAKVHDQFGAVGSVQPQERPVAAPRDLQIYVIDVAWTQALAPRAQALLDYQRHIRCVFSKCLV